MTLPDDVIIYPAHGAGSACGKNMSKETFDTLGNQKKLNYALANLTKEEFIKELTTGILPAPQYFAKNAMLNKNGYGSIDNVKENGTKPLNVEDVKSLILNAGALILDVRNYVDFAKEYIPNSIFIGIDGQFAPWVGAIIKELNQPIILLTPFGREQETVIRLSRVGYDNCLGFIKGGIEEWKNHGNNTESMISISATDFSEKFNTSVLNVLDVRKPGEYESNHIDNVFSNPLDFIEQWQNNLSKDKEYYIHCAGGYRSMIAASLLKRLGYVNLIDVSGGFNAISNTNIKMISTACTN